MKIFKPMPLSLLTRCFEFKGRAWMGVSALLMLSLGEERKLWQDKDLWAFWASRPEGGGALEEGMPRARTEYLVCGHAYPQTAQRNACAVRAEVGGLKKQLNVHGDRFWNGDRPSAAQPFERLPLDWTHTWGGATCPDNPLGMGMAEQDRGGVRVRPLPHIEYPDQALTGPEARGRPAGFGPVDSLWPQRMAKRGTYDDAWFKSHFPAIAPDVDWANAFNVAPLDQQQPSPFIGDEAYVFHNMHPSQPHLAGVLPGLRTRLFVTHRVGDEEKFKEVASSLRALWFFPDGERVILVFQGMHQIAEDDGADIVHLLGAIETIGQPRDPQHYLAVRDKRLDRENGALESLREEDLTPDGWVTPLIDFTPTENRALERGQARGRRERETARAEVASYGLDPDVHAPPVDGPPPPKVENLDDLIALRAKMEALKVEMREKAEQTKKKAIDEVRTLFKKSGRDDFHIIEREVQGLETRGPPKPFADGNIKHFQSLIEHSHATGSDVRELEQMLADPKILAQWHGADAGALQVYRLTAHRKIPVDGLLGEAAIALRQRVMARHAAGGDFAGWDMTGADLSGLDLRGAKLSAALLEKANLTGALLDGADLQDAVLAHAALVSTSLRGANLHGANLGAAHIEKTDFGEADLTDANFELSKLLDVSWRGAKLDGIRLHEAVLSGVDCAQAHAESMLTFLQRDLRGCRFAGARLKLAVFIECNLSGVDFSDAHFEKCAFVTITAIRTNFQRLRIDSGVFAKDCVLQGADFSGAHLPDMNFRGDVLSGAVFRAAILTGSDFSECDLSHADFAQADLRRSRFVRATLADTCLASANLVDAVFQHAILTNTDYRHANLFQSDFARVRIGAGVEMEGALLTRARTYPRHRPEEIKA
jgi:uncharacterized protein YjbI with pentapeptide repeats